MNPSPDQPLPEGRCLYPRINTEGRTVFTPTLTHRSRTDTVDLICGKVWALPIVFVPGIMGSNLMIKGTNTPVWRYDNAPDIALRMAKQGAGKRQRYLHPERTEVDPNGLVPFSVGVLHKPQHFRARGWGEVAAASYQDFLVWLEKTFHGQRGIGIGDSPHAHINRTLRAMTEATGWGLREGFEPLTTEQARLAERWSYPVYAFGYNWLDDNKQSADLLARRIDEIIAANNGKNGHCEQVIVVTHSMGGLVARACAARADMRMKIAGMVHGVMPALGAAVAYRRCKVGLSDEGLGVSLVVGRSGKEVTAVFAQSPGALALLPTTQYPRGWFEIRDTGNYLVPQDSMHLDPYESLYAEQVRYWGLIRKDWLSPVDGVPIRWRDFTDALSRAAEFHKSIQDSYHPNSWAFYGCGVPSFQRVAWRFEWADPTRNLTVPRPPTREAMLDAAGSAKPTCQHPHVVLEGHNPEYLHIPVKQRPANSCEPGPANQRRRLSMQRAGDDGDGTVPTASGRAPEAHVRQMFAIQGLEHEPAYNSSRTRRLTAYCIARIAATATTLFDVPQRQATP